MFKRFIGRFARRTRPDSSNKRGTSFVSFEVPLRQLCGLLKPRKVLEFGPGHSTKLFLEFTGASITSLETNVEWYGKYEEQFASDPVTVRHTPPELDLASLGLADDYDLIFVDGGDRVSALRFARKAVKEGGVVFLHDAHREDYEEGILLFPHVYFPERHSVILTTNVEPFASLKQAVPTDYSCECKYCSPPTRRAYFEKFAES